LVQIDHEEGWGWVSENAIELLHRAIGHPECDLDRPSEAIAKDPDLRSLHNGPEFISFVEEQTARDFAPANPGKAATPG
jgi:hypothetical protein